MTVIRQNKIDILVGMIAPFGMSSVPTGWLACDGSAVSRTTYADLFTAIGTTWGAGDGSGTFALPDLEGAFLRGTGSHPTSGIYKKAGGGAFTGPSVGSFENDHLQGHKHASNSAYDVAGGQYYGSTSGTLVATQDTGVPKTDGTNGTPRTGDETQPFNAGVKYCIKY